MHYDHVHVSFIPMHILIGTWLDVLKFIIKLLFALLIMSEPSKFLGKLMLALIVDRWRRRW